MRLSLVASLISSGLSLHHVTGQKSPQFPIEAGSHSQTDVRLNAYTKGRLLGVDEALLTQDLTIYELLSVLPSTSRLASFISARPALVNQLNSTATSLTLFAPGDSSFSAAEQEMTDDMFRYHLMPYPFSLALLLGTGITTLPSLLYPEKLNGPQRITFDFVAFRLQFRLNSQARISTFDLHASNGVVHLIDSFLQPPPSTFELIAELPASRFWRVQNALLRTGLRGIFDDARGSGSGSTLFMPTNHAWERLGDDVLDFLAGDGHKFLGVLLRHHVVVNLTLYSNNFYNDSRDSDATATAGGTPRLMPSGRRHFNLPTLLSGTELSLDIWRVGPLIMMSISPAIMSSIIDGVSDDGIVHVIESVIMPPCADGQVWKGGLSGFKACLMGYV